MVRDLVVHSVGCWVDLMVVQTVHSKAARMAASKDSPMAVYWVVSWAAQMAVL